MLNALPTNYNKVTEFLIHVPKKPNWGEKLLIALKDERCGNMAHLAQLLDPEGAVLVLLLLMIMQKITKFSCLNLLGCED